MVLTEVEEEVLKWELRTYMPMPSAEPTDTEPAPGGVKPPMSPGIKKIKQQVAAAPKVKGVPQIPGMPGEAELGSAPRGAPQMVTGTEPGAGKPVASGQVAGPGTGKGGKYTKGSVYTITINGKEREAVYVGTGGKWMFGRFNPVGEGAKPSEKLVTTGRKGKAVGFGEGGEPTVKRVDVEANVPTSDMNKEELMKTLVERSKKRHPTWTDEEAAESMAAYALTVLKGVVGKKHFEANKDISAAMKRLSNSPDLLAAAAKKYGKDFGGDEEHPGNKQDIKEITLDGIKNVNNLPAFRSAFHTLTDFGETIGVGFTKNLVQDARPFTYDEGIRDYELGGKKVNEIPGNKLPGGKNTKDGRLFFAWQAGQGGKRQSTYYIHWDGTDFELNVKENEDGTFGGFTVDFAEWEDFGGDADQTSKAWKQRIFLRNDWQANIEDPDHCEQTFLDLTDRAIKGHPVWSEADKRIAAEQKVAELEGQLRESESKAKRAEKIEEWAIKQAKERNKVLTNSVHQAVAGLRMEGVSRDVQNIKRLRESMQKIIGKSGDERQQLADLNKKLSEVEAKIGEKSGELEKKRSATLAEGEVRPEETAEIDEIQALREQASDITGEFGAIADTQADRDDDVHEYFREMQQEWVAKMKAQKVLSQMESGDIEKALMTVLGSQEPEELPEELRVETWKAAHPEAKVAPGTPAPAKKAKKGAKPVARGDEDIKGDIEKVNADLMQIEGLHDEESDSKRKELRAQKKDLLKEQKSLASPAKKGAKPAGKRKPSAKKAPKPEEEGPTGFESSPEFSKAIGKERTSKGAESDATYARISQKSAQFITQEEHAWAARYLAARGKPEDDAEYQWHLKAGGETPAEVKPAAEEAPAEEMEDEEPATAEPVLETSPKVQKAAKKAGRKQAKLVPAKKAAKKAAKPAVESSPEMPRKEMKKRVRTLDRKEKTGTISAKEKKELDALRARMESA